MPQMAKFGRLILCYRLFTAGKSLPMSAKTCCAVNLFIQATDRLSHVIDMLRRHFDIIDGIGLAIHPTDVTVPLLEKLHGQHVHILAPQIHSAGGFRQDGPGIRQSNGVGRTKPHPSRRRGCIRLCTGDAPHALLPLLAHAQVAEAMRRHSIALAGYVGVLTAFFSFVFSIRL